MPEFFLGIDPGLSGGIAFVSHETVHAFDMPVLEYQIKGKKTRREVDVARLARILTKYPARECHLEAIWGIPGRGASEFTFGQSYGMVKAALTLSGIPYHLVSPKKWKNYYGLSNDKEGSRAKATELFPGFKDLWSRKKDDGRAEAVLIANHGRAQAGLNLNHEKETE
jgi:crossover junction endodeoxyribonuclease RuvC